MLVRSPVGITNDGTLNTDTATSVVNGGIDNNATVHARNQVSGEINNNGTGLFHVAGNLAGDDNFNNNGTAQLKVSDGNFTGIATLTNDSTHAAGVDVSANRTLSAGAIVNNNGSTIANSGTLTSTDVIANSGALNNLTSTSVINGGVDNTATGVINNTGTINGGVNSNFGTINSNTATSVINGGMTNSNIVNARNQVNGTIVNGGSGVFTVAGILTGDNSFTNNGNAQLDVSSGNFSGITTLTNNSTNATGVSVSQNRTLSANNIANNLGASISNSGTLTAINAPINNKGTLTNTSTGAINGGVNNTHASAIVDNSGTIHGGITGNIGTVNNQASGIILDQVINSVGGIVNNAGSVENVTNNGTFNSTAASSGITNLTNSGSVNLQGSVAGSLVNNANGLITLNGSLSGGGSLDVTNGGNAQINVSGGNFTGINSLTNNSTNANGISISTGRTLSAESITNATGSTIANSGTLSSTNPIVNSGTLNNLTADSIVNGGLNNDSVNSVFNNIGTINGGVTANLGTINSYDSTSVINGGLNNSGTVFADNQINGAIVNNASGEIYVYSSLAANSTFQNDGYLDVEDSELYGVTTLTNTGEIAVYSDGLLEANNVVNQAGGVIDIDDGGTFSVESANSTPGLLNSGTINLGTSSFLAADRIDNLASGIININAGAGSAWISTDSGISNNNLINLNSGTLLLLSNIAGTGTMNLANNTLLFNGTGSELSIENNVALAAGSESISANTELAIRGNISGNGSINKVGVGNLTLSGNNTFTGQTTIDAGQVTLQGGNAIADTAAVSLGSAGTLKVASAETIGSLSGAAGSNTVLDSNLTFGGANTNTTYSGNISGSGGLVKEGTGITTLNSATANTFTGGVTISNGKIIAATDQQLGSGTLTLSHNGTLQILDGKTQTVRALHNDFGTIQLGNNSSLLLTGNTLNNNAIFDVATNGVVTDAGDINNLATGVFNFNGPGGTSTLSSGTGIITNANQINLNSGALTVVGNVSGTGSINLANGTTLQSGIANQSIANAMTFTGATAIDTQSNALSLSGPITGSGSLTKTGTGNLTLGGTNSYTGGTTVSAGTLTGTTSSVQGAVTNNAAVAFDQTTNGSYSGDMSGTGSLSKDGLGIVTLLGNNTYSGPTNINAGTLRVGSHGTGSITSDITVGAAGTLGGGGTITGNVTNTSGGSISAGNSIGTLTVNGNVNSSNSTIVNELDATSSDLIHATGTANITGATLANQFDPTATYSSHLYKVVQADGGLTGTFANTSSTNVPANFFLSNFYTGTTANVALMSLSDATLPTANTVSILNNAQNTTSTLFDQINSIQYGGLGWIGGPDSTNQTHARRNVWFKGLGFFGDTKAEGAAPGYTSNFGGGVVGIDSGVGEYSRLGIAAGYSAGNVNMKNVAGASSNIDIPLLNVYFARTLEKLTFSSIFGYAFHDVRTTRNITGFGTATGSQDQNAISLAAQFTYLAHAEAWNLLPYFGVQYTHLSQSAYTETGSQGFNMTVLGNNAASFRPYLGVGMQRTLATSGGSLITPQIFGNYSYETQSTSNESAVVLNGSNFNIVGVSPFRSIFTAGTGVNIGFNSSLDSFANYNVNLGDYTVNHAVAGGLVFKY